MEVPSQTDSVPRHLENSVDELMHVYRCSAEEMACWQEHSPELVGLLDVVTLGITERSHDAAIRREESLQNAHELAESAVVLARRPRCRRQRPDAPTPAAQLEELRQRQDKERRAIVGRCVIRGEIRLLMNLMCTDKLRQSMREADGSL